MVLDGGGGAVISTSAADGEREAVRGASIRGGGGGAVSDGREAGS